MTADTGVTATTDTANQITETTTIGKNQISIKDFVIFHFLCYDRILDFRKEDILWQKELLGKTIGHFF